MSPPLSLVSLDILPHASYNCNISICVILGHEYFIAMDCLAWLRWVHNRWCRPGLSHKHRSSLCILLFTFAFLFFQRSAAEPVNWLTVSSLNFYFSTQKEASWFSSTLSCLCHLESLSRMWDTTALGLFSVTVSLKDHTSGLCGIPCFIAFVPPIRFTVLQRFRLEGVPGCSLVFSVVWQCKSFSVFRLCGEL